MYYNHIVDYKYKQMKKNIRYVTTGKRADIKDYIIYRILPNRYANAVGSFIFLDHLPLTRHNIEEPRKIADGTGAHPHRGIATLTYILNGEAEHFDSRGNHAKVSSGGVQWMKTGNGIIHEETVNVDPQANDLLTHALQFWINLPASKKAELPEYLPIQANDIPIKTLKEDIGWLKVIAGSYEDLVSAIPAYSTQFIYHIHLNKGKHFAFETKYQLEYAAFLLSNKAIVNDDELKHKDFISFDEGGNEIDFKATLQEAADIILFGGELCTEPIVAQGPFVMNSQHEIKAAYEDYRNGKYGDIVH